MVICLYSSRVNTALHGSVVNIKTSVITRLPQYGNKNTRRFWHFTSLSLSVVTTPARSTGGTTTCSTAWCNYCSTLDWDLDIDHWAHQARPGWWSRYLSLWIIPGLINTDNGHNYHPTWSLVNSINLIAQIIKTPLGPEGLHDNHNSVLFTWEN